MPKTIERSPSGVTLTVSSPAEPDTSPRLARLPYLPWLAAAVLGSGATVLLGWVAVGACVAAAWITLPTVPPAVVFDTVAQFWIGVHGVPFRAGGLAVGLTPLGLSLTVAVAMAAVARYSARQRDDDGRSSAVAASAIAVACTLAYSLPAWLLASLVGAPKQAAAVFVGALVLSGVGSAVGALRACGVRVLGALPTWLRGLPSGLVAGLATLTAAAVATLGVGVASHTDQIRILHAALAPDAVGSVLLALLYVAYLPTMLLWAGSYALGAGFSVGTGTLVTPSVSELGLVPGLPLAGALPSVPPVYGWAFLAAGPLAGIVAGLVASRWGGRDQLPPLPRIAGSGVAALAAGCSWVLLSWFSRGDLGVGHLVGLGPRFPELAVLTLLPVLGGGLVAGGADALWRVLRHSSDDPDAEVDAEMYDEVTVQVRRG